jgi:protein arginine N-methyltransferase 7
MLAAKHGADNVTTIEAFGPISNVAKKLIEINGFKDQINVIQKHSSKVKLGVDLKERANILITELFDTELIGEGAIDSYNYAHQHLMVQNCLAIPTKASIFIQVIESPAVLAWNKMKLIVDLDGNVLLNPPRNVSPRNFH